MRRPFTLALAALTATAVALSPMPANAAAPQPAAATRTAAAAAGCPRVILIGARGSGEPDKGNGLGPEVNTLYQGLKSALGTVPVGSPQQVSSLSVVYPAVAATTLEPTKAQWAALRTASHLSPIVVAATLAEIMVEYKFTQLDPFVASINEGIASALGELKVEAAQCPQARFVLAGFSQGAMVMHQLLLQLSDAGNTDLLSRIFATALIADGDKVQETAAQHFGTASFDAQGVRTFVDRLIAGAGRDVPTPSSTYDICNAGDLVCDFRVSDLVSTKAFNTAFDIHTKSYIKAPVVGGVAQSIAADLLAVPVVVPLAVATASLPGATQGASYSATLSATGGTAPLTWSIASGSLPSGLSLSPAGGITGVPASPGVASFTVAVRDSTGATATAVLTLNVVEGSIRSGSISAGQFHSCAVTTGGAVKCWGINSYGELGDGTTTSSPTPVDVVGMGSGVAAVSVGGYYSCAVTTAGAVKCWGYNAEGQLGDGTSTDAATPVGVVGLGSGVAAVSSGYDFACAVTGTGAAKCWGGGGYGDLGDGTLNNSSSSTPVGVVGLGSGVAEVSAGSEHACAVTTGGAVKCWGWNNWGQLGSGTPDSSTPVDVVGLGSGVAEVSAGGIHTCAVTTAGTVKCWGNGDYGQLGDGTASSSPTPVDVVGLGSGVAAVSAGAWHTCAVTTGGAAKCWGINNDGELGDGTVTRASTPVDVVGLGSGVAAVSAGAWHTCAMTTGGAAKCWGRNDSGILGDGTTTTNSTTPVDVVGLP